MQINETTSLQPIVAASYDMTAGRLGASAAAVIGLVGIGIAGLALARTTGRARSDTGGGATGGLGRATVAMALGLTGMVLGALFVATADGGLGTGNGLGGAFVAMVLGLIAIALGGLAQARRRRMA